MVELNCTAPFELPETELKGEFTYMKERLYRDEANEKCREKAGMVVPAKSIINIKIKSLLEHFEKNPCFKKSIDIIRIVFGSSSKVELTDGTEYDEKIHEELFPTGYSKNKEAICYDVLLSLKKRKIYEISCDEFDIMPWPFICYVPTPSYHKTNDQVSDHGAAIKATQVELTTAAKGAQVSPTTAIKGASIVFVALLMIIAMIAYTKYALKRSRSLFNHTTNTEECAPSPTNDVAMTVPLNAFKSQIKKN